jgi:hypothetical protein
VAKLLFSEACTSTVGSSLFLLCTNLARLLHWFPWTVCFLFGGFRLSRPVEVLQHYECLVLSPL